MAHTSKLDRRIAALVHEVELYRGDVAAWRDYFRINKRKTNDAAVSGMAIRMARMKHHWCVICNLHQKLYGMCSSAEIHARFCIVPPQSYDGEA